MLKRYTASADTTIVNAYQLNLKTRGTGANAGQADVLETFSIYGREQTGSQELSRILIKFPSSKISADRTAGSIPASGSVSFYLRVFNAPHSKTVPKNYKLVVQPVSQSWQEGDGLDLEGYKDLTYDGPGANWLVANDTLVAATATFGGLAALASDNGTTLTLTNYDGTSVTFTTDSSKAPTAGTATLIGTNGISSNAQATQALHVAFAAAIADSTLSMTLTPSTWTSETSITLTHKLPGPAGNTAIVVPTNVTTQGGSSGADSVFTGGTGRWLSAGGDYLTDRVYTQEFVHGTGDAEINITDMVEDWIKGASGGKYDNHGLGLRMSASYEGSASAAAVREDSNVVENTVGAIKSYYTKRFFARGTQYFFKKPVIEARWDSTKKDDRSNFYLSSSRATADDNMNTLYLYNMVRGRLVNIPKIGTNNIYVSVYSGSKDNTAPSGTALTMCNSKLAATGTWVSTGIYSCAICIPSSSIKTMYDVWFSGSGDGVVGPAAANLSSVQYYTGSFSPKIIDDGNTALTPRHHLSITNLQTNYLSNDIARMNVYVREKNWNPTIYNVAKNTPETKTIISASYRVYRLLDGYGAVPYGTGSDNHTGLSYDIKGNYFDLDMSLLEPGYAYGIKIAFYDSINLSWREQEELFKFRVDKHEY
tara:strand:+ start:851 stop:2803 length:1953 start_codon:yes stop_codon:yes gene_type:complete